MTWGYFEELNPSRFRRIMSQTPVAYVPYAMYEWHGEALPFGTDAFRARYTMGAVARELGGIVMPTPWGTCISRRVGAHVRWGMENFARSQLDGNMCRLEQATFRAMVKDIYAACEHIGFRLTVAYTSHLSPVQVAVLRQCTDAWNKRHEMAALNVQPVRKWSAPGDSPRHADVGEAAEIKLIAPKLVDAKRYACAEADKATGLKPEHGKLITTRRGRELQKQTIRGIVREARLLIKHLKF